MSGELTSLGTESAQETRLLEKNSDQKSVNAQQHSDCFSSSKPDKSIANTHDCCVDNTIVQSSCHCNADSCKGCVNDMSGGGLALLSAKNELPAFPSLVPQARSERLPLSPYQSEIIPPIS